jgi:hypothetical protein
MCHLKNVKQKHVKYVLDIVKYVKKIFVQNVMMIEVVKVEKIMICVKNAKVI